MQEHWLQLLPRRILKLQLLCQCRVPLNTLGLDLLIMEQNYQLHIHNRESQRHSGQTLKWKGLLVIQASATAENLARTEIQTLTLPVPLVEGSAAARVLGLVLLG